MSTETAAPPQTDKQAVSADGWKDRSVHKGITLASGAVVDIKLPNLTKLAKADAIPNELLELVTEVVTNGGVDGVDTSLLGRLDALHRFLVAETVVNPNITEEDVDDLPPEDVATLVEFAFRQRDTDVIGHHLGGLETVAEWRRFRNLPSLEPGLLDA